jgi:menaquinone-dependent protoporphyrinogen IX oxidase
MLRILIAHDTTEGQTRKIALHMANALSSGGKNVQVIDIRPHLTGFTLDGFDAILIGAFVHLRTACNPKDRHRLFKEEVPGRCQAPESS